jgi:hypothetical protein
MTSALVVVVKNTRIVAANKNSQKGLSLLVFVLITGKQNARDLFLGLPKWI